MKRDNNKAYRSDIQEGSRPDNNKDPKSLIEVHVGVSDGNVETGIMMAKRYLMEELSMSFDKLEYVGFANGKRRERYSFFWRMKQ